MFTDADGAATMAAGLALLSPLGFDDAAAVGAGAGEANSDGGRVIPPNALPAKQQKVDTRNKVDFTCIILLVVINFIHKNKV